jgi:hypothetical protein
MNERRIEMDRIEARVISHSQIGRRGIWVYMVPSNLGDMYVTQHETEAMSLQDDYIGWDPEKADAVYKRVTTRIVSGKM